MPQNSNFSVDLISLYINTDPIHDFIGNFFVRCSNSKITVDSAKTLVNVTYWVPPPPPEPIEVQISPEFKGSLKNINFTLNFTDELVIKEFSSKIFEEFEFKMPTINDVNNDFETIQFENGLFGSIFWTNTTNDKVLKSFEKSEIKSDNVYMSFNKEKMKLTVYL